VSSFIQVSRRTFKVWEWALRAVIGIAFIYAGWLKVQDPAGFADSVAAFAILPKWSISGFALALPIFEIIAGTLLIIGRPRRIGALALTLLSSVFCIALIWAIARGLKVNCGCFGPSVSAVDPRLDLGRDLAILLGCCFLYRADWFYRSTTAPPQTITAE
jgi:putative oxidoreductase